VTSGTSTAGLPMPPRVMRELVGRPEEEEFEAGDTRPVLEGLSPRSRVLDFGSGCGRTARQLLAADPRPASYLGVDLHRGMVDWCQRHLTPIDPAFRFVHHDVESPCLNPGDKPRTLPLPADDASFDLVYAASVFTHLRESQVPAYLQECARVLAPGGVVRATWFLFDKRPFPMMQAFQNAVYVNDEDPTNAAVFDREWFLRLVAELGLAVTAVVPPAIRGFHWWVDLQHVGDGEPVELPEDTAPFGSHPPPVVTVPMSTVVEEPAQQGRLSRALRRPRG
jgi:SAM-dependent methyltransferase